MRALLFVIVAASCASGGAPSMKLPVCTTAADCAAHDKERVEIIGVYSVWSPRPGLPATDPRARQVRIHIEGSEGGPFLEAGHDPRHKRAPEEIAKFRDRRVRVVGTYVERMPQVKGPEHAQLAGACISDVEVIELAE